MCLPLEFTQEAYSNVRHRSACFIKEGLMRAKVQVSVVAMSFDGTPNSEPLAWKCFENVGQDAYRLEKRSLHRNVTTAWLTHDFSHRASSN